MLKPSGPVIYSIFKGANVFPNPIRWLRDRYHARLRKTDIDILWPAYREGSNFLADAKFAFSQHTEHNFAWRNLSVAERRAVVEGLK